MLDRPPTRAEYHAYRQPGEPTTHHIAKRYGGWLKTRERFLSPASVSPVDKPFRAGASYTIEQA